jgi:hypothetical protein
MKYIILLISTNIIFSFLHTTVKAQEIKNRTYISDGIIIKAGVSLNSVSVKANNTNIAPGGTKFKSSASPVFEAGYISDIGDKRGKIFFNPKVKISSFKNSGTQDVLLTDGSVYQHVTTTEKSAALIDAVLGFGFSIINSKEAVMIFSAGPAITLMAGNKQTMEKKDARTGTVTSTEDDGRHVSFHITGDLSVILKNKFIIWFASGTPTTTTSFTQYSPRLLCIQAGLGLKI